MELGQQLTEQVSQEQHTKSFKERSLFWTKNTDLTVGYLIGLLQCADEYFTYKTASGERNLGRAGGGEPMTVRRLLENLPHTNGEEASMSTVER